MNMIKMVTRLDTLLDELIEREEIHTAVLSVASGDGTFRWAGARGPVCPDGAPMTATTLWLIASITKLFILATVLRLVEEGDRAWSLEDTAWRVREQLTPHFPPQSLGARRTRIRYSDTNQQLLIGIIEARRDAPFFQILEDLVLNPPGLENSWLPGHSHVTGQESDVAALYAEAGEGHIPSSQLIDGSRAST
jgi:CubicO group peptidase (beta-lactamase class C family)